jgi:hypothetical protein
MMLMSLLRITAQQATQETLRLFDITKPTMPRAFQVLEGLNRGQILMDDPASPTTAVVRDGMNGNLYFGGDVSVPLVTSLASHFRETGEVGIGCWLGDPLNLRITSDFDYAGMTYGSVERVLKYTLGAVVVHRDAVGCEAATGAPTHGWIEVGVTTAETYRGKGLAGIAAARLIEMCEEQGYCIWWDCAKQNVPSVRLAKKNTCLPTRTGVSICLVGKKVAEENHVRTHAAKSRFWSLSLASPARSRTPTPF